jgi:hypothetical protein
MCLSKYDIVYLQFLYVNYTSIKVEKTLRLISVMNINRKIFNKVLGNQTQQHIKRMTHHIQVEFIPKQQR